MNELMPLSQQWVRYENEIGPSHSHALSPSHPLSSAMEWRSRPMPGVGPSILDFQPPEV